MPTITPCTIPWTLRLASVVAFLACLPAAPAQKQDWPEYVPSQVSGIIRVCGSPQMSDMLRREEAAFQLVHPSVRFENSLKSTITAVTGVSSNRADIGLLGREIWPSEQEAFVSVSGHRPTVIEIATGSYNVPKATFALMIFVNRANPMRSLSLDQLGAVFGADESAPPPVWRDAGLAGAWARRPIHLYGFARDNDKARIFGRLVFSRHLHWAAGLHEFRNIAGPPAIDAGEQILRAVAADPEGIGISNVFYALAGVRVVPIAPRSGAAPVTPSRATIADRSYPLWRSVSAIIDGEARTAAAPAVREFLRFIISRQGQAEISRVGTYLPLTPEVAGRQRSLLSTLAP
jgi:phosphate transport system substrate-binding protein